MELRVYLGSLDCTGEQDVNTEGRTGLKKNIFHKKNKCSKKQTNKKHVYNQANTRESKQANNPRGDEESALSNTGI